jgi:hypothetical protein
MMPGDPSDVLLRRRSLLQLAFLAAAGVAVPAAVCRLLPDDEMEDNEPTELDVDPEIRRQELARMKPDWFLIGNSMLNSRIQWPQLQAVSGHRVRKLGLGGTQSAVWWLFFKNIVIGSGHYPACVTFFFRESDLSWPEFRIGGNNGRLIRKTRYEHEPEWAQVLGWRENEGGPAAALAARVFPVGEQGNRSRRKMAKLAMSVTDVGNIPHGTRRVELNELFSIENLRRDLGDDAAPTASSKPSLTDLANVAGLPDPGMYDEAPTIFDPSPHASFLPHMVALAKTHGIRLHFHRVKRRPLPDGTRPDLPAMSDYLTDLRAWLQSQGCAYSDESGDRELTEGWYRDGDHIATTHRERFAAKFWNLVKDQIGPPPGAAASAQ